MSNKGSEEDESGYEPEDKLQTTIEKSKKVLEMQRELLQQVLSFIFYGIIWIVPSLSSEFPFLTKVVFLLIFTCKKVDIFWTLVIQL